MDKGAKNKLVGSPGENGGGQDAQKDLHLRTGRDETKRKIQERMERRSRKGSSSVGSEKMERVGDRWRDIIRQAKAHNGLQGQRKKKKKQQQYQNSFSTSAQDSHLQRVTIPEAAYIQLRRTPPEDEQGNVRDMQRILINVLYIIK